MLSCQNNIFYPLSQQLSFQQNWQIYGLFYLKTKMGVIGLIFEPQPPYFANQCNFCRCTNDVTMTFWYLYWFQICKKPLGVSFPGSSVLWLDGPFVIRKAVWQSGLRRTLQIFAGKVQWKCSGTTAHGVQLFHCTRLQVKTEITAVTWMYFFLQQNECRIHNQ